MGHKKSVIIGLIVTLTVLLPSTVSGQTLLFQDWYYGQHIEDFPSSQGYFDCSAIDLTPMLCLNDIPLVQQSFTGRFIFDVEGRLVSLTIASPYSQATFESLSADLNHGFKVIFLEGATVTLDLIEHENSRVTEFIDEQLQEGYLAANYVETPLLGESTASNSAHELLLEMPVDRRAVDLVMSEDQFGAWIEATFYFPGQQLADTEGFGS